MLKKFVSAGDDRSSRFHTEDNVFIGWKSVIAETPFSAAYKIYNKLAGSRPALPWWPLPAIKAVEKRLKSDMKSIEFGSGGSSIWIAKRVGSLIVREHDEAWAEVTRKRLSEAGVNNCEVQLRTLQSYYSLVNLDSFDFAVVDGEYRWKCIENLTKKMKSGGMIYFDNSDSDKDAKYYDEFGLTGTHHAQTIIRRLEVIRGAHIEVFRGMIHGELFAGSGILLTFP